MKQEREDSRPATTDAVRESSKPDGKGIDEQAPVSEFHPIRIKGEPLSATIIRERREGY